MDWEGIPVFCGDFDGGGHTITGLSVTGDGLQKGLFRTLTETARVHDLNLQGTVAPQGSRSQVGGIAGVSDGLDSLKSQAQSARDAAAALVPKPGELPDLPDRDSIQAAKNDLTSRIQNLNQTVSGMSASVEGSVDALTGDLQAITDQMNAINQTVNQAGDYLGWGFTDVSDEDTADDQTAKVEGCVNEGEVCADWNAGGIAGAMAPENDLDTLTSVEFYGEKSLHLYGQMRAVLLNCTNSAPVYAGKQNAGGTGILVLAAGAGILLARRRKRKTTV